MSRNVSDLCRFRDSFLFERIQLSNLLDVAKLLHQPPTPPARHELLI